MKHMIRACIYTSFLINILLFSDVAWKNVTIKFGVCELILTRLLMLYDIR